MSSRRAVAIKIVVTIALLTFVVYRMDFLRFVEILFSANLLLVLLAILVQFCGVGLSVIRWRTVLGNFDMHPDLSSLTKINLMGNFFNLFLPSGIGGDFFRAYYLSKRERRGMSTTLTTTILERNAGMCALLVIGGSFAALYRIEVQGVSLLYVFAFVITGYLLATFVLFHTWTHRKISAFLRRRNLEQWEAKMELVAEGLNSLCSNKGSIGIAILTSLVIQFMASVIVWIAALSIAIDAPFIVFLIFVPLINLSVMVPLTINGIGLRESLFYLLFSQIGVPVEMAVSLSLVNFLIVVLVAIPGGIIYSLYKKEEHLDEILVEAEES